MRAPDLSHDETFSGGGVVAGLDSQDILRRASSPSASQKMMNATLCHQIVR